MDEGVIWKIDAFTISCSLLSNIMWHINLKSKCASTQPTSPADKNVSLNQQTGQHLKPTVTTSAQGSKKDRYHTKWPQNPQTPLHKTMKPKKTMFCYPHELAKRTRPLTRKWYIHETPAVNLKLYLRNHATLPSTHHKQTRHQSFQYPNYSSAL